MRYMYNGLRTCVRSARLFVRVQVALRALLMAVEGNFSIQRTI